MSRRLIRTIATCAGLALLALAAPATAQDGDTLAADGAKAAQAPEQPKAWMDIYGFAMLDIGQNFKTDRPELVRHDARQQAAVGGGPVRPGRTRRSRASARAASA